MRKLVLGSVTAVALVTLGVVIGRGRGADVRVVRAPAFTVEKDGEVRTIELSSEHAPPVRAADGVKLFKRAQGDDKLWSRAWLVKFLEENPEQAVELLAMFESETDPEVLEALAEALGADPRIAGNPEVVKAMLRIAETGDDPNRRLAALAVLMKLPHLTPEATETIFRIARNDVRNEVRIGALAVAVDWMQTHPGERAAISREVLDVARGATDSEVRGHAIQAIALQDAGMPADVVQGVGPFLTGDASEQNRSLAAMALGNAGVEQRAWALATLENAFLRESSPEVRREMLIHLVRAGRGDALPALERLATTNADAADYVQILKSGITDPIAVFERKQDLDAERGVVAPHEHHD